MFYLYEHNCEVMMARWLWLLIDINLHLFSFLPAHSKKTKKTAEIIWSHIFKYIMRELLQFQYIFHNDNGHHNHSSSCVRQSDKRDRWNALTHIYNIRLHCREWKFLAPCLRHCWRLCTICLLPDPQRLYLFCDNSRIIA